MKQLFFIVTLSSILGACTSPQENKTEKKSIDTLTQANKDTLKQKVEENKTKTEEQTDTSEIKETQETIREEP